MSLLNKAINSLGTELHIPTYRFCGPGTKLEKRLTRGDKGIDLLDEACKEHDIAYSKHSDLAERHKADQLLSSKAWNRFKSSDAGLKERLSALAVAAAMKAKVKMGMGTRQRRRSKKVNFSKFVKRIGLAIKRKGVQTTSGAIRGAMKHAKLLKPSNVSLPKIIPLPKKGGFLPFLIPLFAGLSAVGALGSAASNIASAVNKAQEAQKSLDEAKRHNQTMEAIAVGKGLYLAPYRSGCGLFLNPYKSGCGVKCRKFKKN